MSEIELMVGCGQLKSIDGVVSPMSASQGRVESLTRFSGRKRGRSPSHELAVTLRLRGGLGAKNSRRLFEGLARDRDGVAGDVAVMALGMVNWRAMAGSSVWDEPSERLALAIGRLKTITGGLRVGPSKAPASSSGTFICW